MSADRLNAPIPQAVGGQATMPMCLECGEAIHGSLRAEFCSGRCKANWHNRRAKRGAIFHDLILVNRYERDIAKDEKVMSLISAFALQCREEDKAQRAGRKSWRPLKAVLADHPHLRAVVVWRGKRKEKAS